MAARTGIFSPEVEKEFLACESEYTETDDKVEETEDCVPCSALRENDSSSESESETGYSEVDDTVDSEVNDVVGKTDKLESMKLRKLFRDSCGCKLGAKGNPCSSQFTPDIVKMQRDNCSALDKEALDMVVIGQFQANGAETHGNDTKMTTLHWFIF